MSLLSEEVISGLKGGVTRDEANLLRRRASEVRRGCIVEIGSFRGLSALALAQGVRDSGNKPAVPIYCIEPHRSFRGLYGGDFGPADRGIFFETMSRTGAFSEIALVNLTSEEAAPGWRLPVGLLFIDDDHRYEAVRRDLEIWEPHLIPGAIVAFDDAKDESGGPIRVVRELVGSARYTKVEELGKIVVLQKTGRPLFGVDTFPSRPQRILVVCRDLLPAGGLIRFDRVGQVLKGWGHTLSFVSLAATPQRTCPLNVPLLRLEEASEQSWDAVMLPGAGFPTETIERLTIFRAPNFGVRVQHILNDQSRRKVFRAANGSFAPHVVIFNNEHWPVGSFTDFAADRFHLLLGAVDSQRFRPLPYRQVPLEGGRWVVGGLAHKNPEPLIEALHYMAPGAALRLFGPDRFDLKKRYESLIAQGSLALVGSVFGRELQQYYEGVDCVVSTALAAGWSNLAAEAMASGVPVICNRQGTLAFARDGETALLVEPVTAPALGAQLQRLREEPELCRKLTVEARKRVENFSWETYSQQLLSLLQHDGSHHYTFSPQDALFGKWAPEDRLRGLKPLLDRTAGLSVLDLGAAEGLVARQFLRGGASFVHGFDLDPDRVQTAASLCIGGQARFETADLSDWPACIDSHRSWMSDSYDIVLHLGLYQHLSPAVRTTVLRDSIRLAKQHVAFRAPAALYHSDGIENVFKEEGFARLTEARETTEASHLGPCHLFTRS